MYLQLATVYVRVDSRSQRCQTFFLCKYLTSQLLDLGCLFPFAFLIFAWSKYLSLHVLQPNYLRQRMLAEFRCFSTSLQRHCNLSVLHSSLFQHYHTCPVLRTCVFRLFLLVFNLLHANSILENRRLIVVDYSFERNCVFQIPL